MPTRPAPYARARARCRMPGRREARGGPECGTRSDTGRAAAAAVDDAPHPRGAEPLVSAGIRADEHAASPSRTRDASSGGRPHAQQACGEAALPCAWRKAFAYRCGGSTGWHGCGAAERPVSRLTARAGKARASTETRASVGVAGGSVKARRRAGRNAHAARAAPSAIALRSLVRAGQADVGMRPVRRIRPAVGNPGLARDVRRMIANQFAAAQCIGCRIDPDRMRARSAGPPGQWHAVLSYAPRSVLAPALRRAQLNGKQEAARPPGLCCPRNGTPPA